MHLFQNCLKKSKIEISKLNLIKNQNKINSKILHKTVASNLFKQGSDSDSDHDTSELDSCDSSDENLYQIKQVVSIYLSMSLSISSIYLYLSNLSNLSLYLSHLSNLNIYLSIGTSYSSSPRNQIPSM
jgi:hypothetical protein